MSANSSSKIDPGSVLRCIAQHVQHSFGHDGIPLDEYMEAYLGLDSDHEAYIQDERERINRKAGNCTPSSYANLSKVMKPSYCFPLHGHDARLDPEAHSFASSLLPYYSNVTPDNFNNHLPHDQVRSGDQSDADQPAAHFGSAYAPDADGIIPSACTPPELINGGPALLPLSMNPPPASTHDTEALAHYIAHKIHTEQRGLQGGRVPTPPLPEGGTDTEKLRALQTQLRNAREQLRSSNAVVVEFRRLIELEQEKGKLKDAEIASLKKEKADLEEEFGRRVVAASYILYQGTRGSTGDQSQAVMPVSGE